jgi:hypothetical protein
MLKSIVGVVVGYLVMTVVAFAIFTGAYFALGVEHIFQPGTYEVSTLWLLLSALLSVGGSILGGYICAAISGSKRACQVFAGIMLVTLILFCIPKMRDPAPQVRAADVSSMEAMQRTQMPIWMHVLNPVLAAVGVLLGARMKGLPAV